MSTHVCEEENNVHKMNEEEHALTFNNTPPQQPYVNKHAQHASITIEGPYVQQHQQPHAMQHALETIEHLQQEGHATRNTTTPTPPLQSEYVWTFSPTTTGACMLDTFSTTHNHAQSKINVVSIHHDCSTLKCTCVMHDTCIACLLYYHSNLYT